MLRRFAAIASLVAVPLGATPVLVTGSGNGGSLWGDVILEGPGVNLHMALEGGPQFVVICPMGVVCRFDWSGGGVNSIDSWKIGGSYKGHAITNFTHAFGGAHFIAYASFTKENPSAVVPVSVSGEVWLPEAQLYFTGTGIAHIWEGQYYTSNTGPPGFVFEGFGTVNFHGTLDEVPEPATLLLLAPAILLALRRKKQTPSEP